MTADAARAAMVSVDQLRFHPRNVRVDLGDLRELAASIAEIGVQEPLVVEDCIGSGRVLMGHRRLAAARLARVRKVPCLLVAPKPDDEAIAHMFSENRHRLPMTPEEKTAAVRSLAHEFGWSNARIAKRLGVSPATASRWMAGRNDDEATELGKGVGAGNPNHGRGASTARRLAGHSAKSTVSTRKVRDILDRWRDEAPPELLAELRDLVG